MHVVGSFAPQISDLMAFTQSRPSVCICYAIRPLLGVVLNSEREVIDFVAELPRNFFIHYAMALILFFVFVVLIEFPVKGFTADV